VTGLHVDGLGAEDEGDIEALLGGGKACAAVVQIGFLRPICLTRKEL
jgi:hypothetical protein